MKKHLWVILLLLAVVFRAVPAGADLGKDDPRRAELIAWINEGLLPVPYHESCNLADYEELAALAAANRE